MRYAIVLDHDYSKPIGHITIDNPDVVLMLEKDYPFSLSAIKVEIGPKSGHIVGLNISARIFGEGD